jgi:hypothetical protein
MILQILGFCVCTQRLRFLGDVMESLVESLQNHSWKLVNIMLNVPSTLLKAVL